MHGGESHPTGKIGGGYTVLHSIEGGTIRNGEIESGNGLCMKLTGAIDTLPSGAHDFSMGAEALSPRTASQIDRKMDDGRPWQGIVRATSWGVPADAAMGTCEYEYDEQNTKKGCIMCFMIE